MAEMAADKLTPDTAILGLKASTSDFIPSVGGVRRLAHAAMGPPTCAQIAAAEARARLAAEPALRRLTAA